MCVDILSMTGYTVNYPEIKHFDQMTFINNQYILYLQNFGM